jgi:hypothetical protein
LFTNSAGPLLPHKYAFLIGMAFLHPDRLTGRQAGEKAVFPSELLLRALNPPLLVSHYQNFSQIGFEERSLY